MLSFSCVFARWTRWYYWCIVVDFRFLASGARLCCVSCKTLSFSQFQPCMCVILTHTHLLLLSISNLKLAVLCLPRFWAPQSMVLTTSPSHVSILVLW